MKRIISLCLAVLLFLSTSNVAYAKEQKVAPENFGAPVEVNTYEEDGATVVEKVYFVADQSAGSMSRGKSGAGWYKNEKTYTWSGGTVMTYFAQGYFVWGNGEVSVSNPYGGVSNVPSESTLVYQKLSTGTGKYAWVFNNYAYVTLDLSVVNWVGLTSDFSVTIRVSESGNTI